MSTGDRPAEAHLRFLQGRENDVAQICFECEEGVTTVSRSVRGEASWSESPLSIAAKRPEQVSVASISVTLRVVGAPKPVPVPDDQSNLQVTPPKEASGKGPTGGSRLVARLVSETHSLEEWTESLNTRSQKHCLICG